jgi:hypothetical protein
MKTEAAYALLVWILIEKLSKTHTNQAVEANK